MINCLGRENKAARENTMMPIPHVLNTAVVTTNDEVMREEESKKHTVTGYRAEASD
jgi:hypothetical protein